MWSKISGWMMVSLAVLVLGGCASFSYQTEFAQESELVAKRGQPTRVWNNDDGTRTYEYATQPQGSTCWMYTIDAGGRVVEQHDALTDRNLARVRPGMSKFEVQRMLGEENSITHYRRMNEEVWDWNVRTEHGFAGTFFNVHFVDDVVARTSYTQIHFGNGGDGGLSGGFFHPFGSHWSYGIGYGHGMGFGHSFGYGFGHPFGRGGFGWSHW